MGVLPLFVPVESASGPAYTADFMTGTLPAGMTFTRASAATYIDSTGTRQTAATNVPRFDYNPSTLQLRGLLIEDQRTNFLLNSTAPVTQTTASLSATTYTLWCEGAGSATSSAGTAVGTGFGVATAGSPNTFTTTGAGTIQITVTGSVTVFQLEASAFPTSLIITAGTTATRSPDSLVLSGTPWYNVPQGSMYTEASLLGMPGGSGSRVGVLAQGATTNNFYSHTLFTTGMTVGWRSASVASASISNAFVPTAFTVYKTASAYALNDFATSTNGSAVITAASGNVPVTIDTLYGGRVSTSLTQLLNGHLRKITYYNTRLSNAALVSMTT